MPPVLRIATRCRNADEMVAAFATLVDERSMIVLTEQTPPLGSRVVFVFELADGVAAMSGEAEVVEATTRGRLRLQLLALDGPSRVLHRRMLDRKTGVTTPVSDAAPRAVAHIPERVRPPTAPPAPPPIDPPPPRHRTSSSIPVPAIVPTRARPSRTRPPPATEPLVIDIDRMLALMRRIPDPDHAAGLRALRASLASVGVALPPIIDDALRREGDLEDRIAGLEREIDARAQEIEHRAQEIARLERDAAETAQVRSKLERALGRMN